MENYRKRQRWRAEERVAQEREHLLRAFLEVADNLERALSAERADVASLRRGVEMTARTLRQLLDREGVQPIEAEGQPFDPTWHEAVSTVPHQKVDLERDAVVEVVRPGYRLEDRLLRPARVVVTV
jgi:molecular chaperone GrpE